MYHSCPVVRRSVMQCVNDIHHKFYEKKKNRNTETLCVFRILFKSETIQVKVETDNMLLSAHFPNLVYGFLFVDSSEK